MEQILRNIIVEQIQDPLFFSRNRNYHAYSDAAVRDARRLGRFFRSLIADMRLAAAGPGFSIEACGDESSHFVIRLDFPAIHGRRTCFLSREHIEIIMEIDDVRLWLGPFFAKTAQSAAGVSENHDKCVVAGRRRP